MMTFEQWKDYFIFSGMFSEKNLKYIYNFEYKKIFPVNFREFLNTSIKSAFVIDNIWTNNTNLYPGRYEGQAAIDVLKQRVDNFHNKGALYQHIDIFGNLYNTHLYVSLYPRPEYADFINLWNQFNNDAVNKELSYIKQNGIFNFYDNKNDFIIYKNWSFQTPDIKPRQINLPTYIQTGFQAYYEPGFTFDQLAEFLKIEMSEKDYLYLADVYNSFIKYGQSYRSNLTQYTLQLKNDLDRLNRESKEKIRQAQYEKDKSIIEAKKDLFKLQDEYSRHFEILKYTALGITQNL